MGQVYGKMGKNDLSLVYYQEAQKLNPSNGVLLYLVGTVRSAIPSLTFFFFCLSNENEHRSDDYRNKIGAPHTLPTLPHGKECIETQTQKERKKVTVYQD